jgi:hypothetical protein
MSVYPPPTNDLPIFNPSEFESSSSTLTISTADSRYLKLTGGTESGLVTFASGLTIGAGNAIGTLKIGSATYAPGALAPQTSSTTLAIPFGITFSVAPTVVATLNTASYTLSDAVVLTITSISTTQFVITLFNSSTTNTTPGGASYKINWFAS